MQIRIFFLEFFCYNLRLLLKEHVRSYVNRLKTQTMNLKAIFNHFKSSAKWNSMIKRDCHSIGMYMKYNHKTSDVKIEINKCGGLNSSSAWPFHRITQSNRHTHIYIYIYYCQSALISYYAVLCRGRFNVHNAFSGSQHHY